MLWYAIKKVIFMHSSFFLFVSIACDNASSPCLGSPHCAVECDDVVQCEWTEEDEASRNMRLVS